VVQLIEHAPPKILGSILFAEGSFEVLKNGSPDLSSGVRSINGWAERNGSPEVLQMNHHQGSIHHESRRTVHGQSKWRWALLTTRDIPKRGSEANIAKLN